MHRQQLKLLLALHLLLLGHWGKEDVVGWMDEVLLSVLRCQLTY